MENLGIHQLPFSMEAEQSTLGAILIQPAECFEAIGSFLSSDDFYIEEHRCIYAALVDMYANSRTIDLVTLVNTLVESGHRDQSTGLQYIKQIAEMVPSASNVRDYAKIVHNKSLLRRLISAAEEVTDMAYSEEGDVAEIVDSAEQKFFDIAQNRDSKEFRHIRDVLKVVYQNYTDIAAKTKEDTGTHTGFTDLDSKLVEIGRGDFVLIGARPGMGKTAFALSIAANVARVSSKAVCIFSLEMTAEQLVNRLMASEAMVDSTKLRTGELNHEEWGRLAHAATVLANMNILIDDTSEINPLQIKGKLRRVKDLGLVIIDYLGLVQATKRVENRTQEVGDITRHLKIMAKELGVPVICCAQLSRGTEGRSDKRPQLSDLRESGNIEQDADMVMFIYRSGYYDREGGSADAPVGETNVAEVIIAKNRHGSIGTVKMGWISQYTKFCSLDNGKES